MKEVKKGGYSWPNGSDGLAPKGAIQGLNARGGQRTLVGSPRPAARPATICVAGLGRLIAREEKLIRKREVGPPQVPSEGRASGADVCGVSGARATDASGGRGVRRGVLQGAQCCLERVHPVEQVTHEHPVRGSHFRCVLGVCLLGIVGAGMAFRVSTKCGWRVRSVGRSGTSEAHVREGTARRERGGVPKTTTVDLPRGGEGLKNRKTVLYMCVSPERGTCLGLKNTFSVLFWHKFDGPAPSKPLFCVVYVSQKSAPIFPGRPKPATSHIWCSPLWVLGPKNDLFQNRTKPKKNTF